MNRPRVLAAGAHQAILVHVSCHLENEFETIAAVPDGRAAFGATLALKPDAVVEWKFFFWACFLTGAILLPHAGIKPVVEAWLSPR